MCKKPIVVAVAWSLCLISSANATVVWDFEDGEDHRFELWSAKGGLFSQDLPDVAGDERLTGVGTGLALPEAGVAWSVGPPDQYNGLTPPVVEGNHVGADGLLDWTLNGHPISSGTDFDNVNVRGQTSYLNTYNLNMWGDGLHSAANDQIATSLPVTLGENAVLTVWAHGGGNGTHAPEYDADPDALYTDGSAGIAVISADDFSFLASVKIGGKGTLQEDTLDLSAFAGQRVLIEVVDAFEGSWGWLAVDEVQITNATPDKIAAFITAAADLTAGLDRVQVDRLESLGYIVQVVESGEVDDTFTRADANDLDLLVISESIGSSSADPLIGTSTPTLHQESYGWDNWGFITENASVWQTTTDVNVINDTHPIAMGANLALGDVPFFSTSGEQTTSLVSILAPGVELIGQITVDSNDYSLIWAMEVGAERADGTPSPNRAVGFSLPGNGAADFPADHLTDAAWAWFDASVRWLDPPPSENALSEGLLGYWPLDEGAGTITADASGSGNAGIVNGDATWAEGKLGMAIDFDGIDDHVDVGNDPSLDQGTNDFTISAWVKTTVAADSSVFGKGGDDGGGIRYRLYLQGNPGVKILVDDDMTKYDPEGDIAVADDQWHHLVGMRDGGTTLRVFIDGVEDQGVVNHGESTIPAEYDISGSSQYGALIGAFTTNNDGSLIKFFDGLIDDVAVWNRALSEDEISYLWNEGQGNPVVAP